MTALVVVGTAAVLLLAVHLWYLRRVRAAGEEAALERGEAASRVLRVRFLLSMHLFVGGEGRWHHGGQVAD